LRIVQVILLITNILGGYKLVAIGRGRPAEIVGENVTGEFFWLYFRNHFDQTVV